MFRDMIAAWGTMDILVSNAGLQRDAALVDMTLEQWNTVLGVNLTGTFLCVREAAREMIRRGPRPAVSQATGKIICISSVHERIPAGHVNYAASKGGMMLFMKSRRRAGAPIVRVNLSARGHSDADQHRRLVHLRGAGSLLTMILRRIGQPAMVVGGGVFASDDADYIHGQTVFVDGGMTLYPEFARGASAHPWAPSAPASTPPAPRPPTGSAGARTRGARGMVREDHCRTERRAYFLHEHASRRIAGDRRLRLRQPPAARRLALELARPDPEGAAFGPRVPRGPRGREGVLLTRRHADHAYMRGLYKHRSRAPRAPPKRTAPWAGPAEFSCSTPGSRRRPY